jgi:hypothetical protein
MAYSTTLSPTPAAGKAIRYTWFTQLLENINLINGSHTDENPTSYSPTWASTGGTPITVGNAVTTGQYKKFGNYVFFELKWVFGSTSADGASNAFTWTLPTTAASATAFGAFSAVLTDATGNHYPGTGKLLTTTTFIVVVGGASGGIGADVPIAFAQDDTLFVSGFYKEA